MRRTANPISGRQDRLAVGLLQRAAIPAQWAVHDGDRGDPGAWGRRAGGARRVGRAAEGRQGQPVPVPQVTAGAARRQSDPGDRRERPPATARPVSWPSTSTLLFSLSALTLFIYLR